MNFEKEVLTLENIHNEYVMTSLRTSWGCYPLKINPFFAENFNKKIAELNRKKVLDNSKWKELYFNISRQIIS